MSEHIRIFTGSPVIVRRLEFLLDASGIGSVYKNQDESARMAGFGGPMNWAELFILNTDLEKHNLLLLITKKKSTDKNLR